MLPDLPKSDWEVGESRQIFSLIIYVFNVPNE